MKRFVKHYLFPHHTNNYRARALHIDTLALYAVLLLLFQVVMQSVHKRAPDVLGYATDISVSVLLSETNARRTQAGLAPLQLNESLSHAAAGKAQHMFAHNYWAHNAPDGTSPWDFILGAGYDYAYAGENLAKNFLTSAQVVDAWIASETHRDNIMKDSYTQIGFAIVNGVLLGEETTLVVQMFGTPSTGIAQAPAAPVSPPIGDDNSGAIDQVLAQERIQDTLPVTSEEGLIVIDQTVGQSAPYEGATGGNVFSTAINSPLFDMFRIEKGLLYGFVGFILGLLVVDAWIILRKRIVRVRGHSLGHAFFFLSLVFILSQSTFGSII